MAASITLPPLGSEERWCWVWPSTCGNGLLLMLKVPFGIFTMPVPAVHWWVLRPIRLDPKWSCVWEAMEGVNGDLAIHSGLFEFAEKNVPESSDLSSSHRPNEGGGSGTWIVVAVGQHAEEAKTARTGMPTASVFPIFSQGYCTSSWKLKKPLGYTPRVSW